MNSSPPFHPYGVAHLLVIFLTIALPFALAALVRRTKSSAIERIIVGALSCALVVNYFVYLSLVRQFGAVSWEQLLPLQRSEERRVGRECRSRWGAPEW